MENNSTVGASRRATFKAATTGMRAYTIARKLSPDLYARIDFRGLTKKQLADEFADGNLSHLSGQELRDMMYQQAATFTLR